MIPAAQRTVTSEEGAAFLIDRTKHRYVEPFLGRECTLAEAAKLLGSSKPAVSYWVNKMLELGLIGVVRTEKQGKSRVRVYRTTAERFIVPLALISAESDEALLESNMGTYWQLFKRSLAQAGRKNAAGWHVRFQREGRFVANRIVPESGSLEDAKIVNYWARLSLNAEQAETLRKELEALLERYMALSQEGEKVHVLHLGMVERAS